MPVDSNDRDAHDCDGGIAFWDAASGAIRRFVEAEHLRAFSSTGHRVFAGTGDALIALSTEDGSEVWTATLPGAPVGRLDADVHVADEQGVVQHGHAQLVIALSLRTGRERYRLSGTVALHDRDVFLIRDASGVSLRAIELGGPIVTLSAVGDGTFALSPDRRWLAVHHHDVTLWDLTTRTPRHRWSVEHTFNGFSFRDDSAALVVSSYQTQQSGTPRPGRRRRTLVRSNLSRSLVTATFLLLSVAACGAPRIASRPALDGTEAGHCHVADDRGNVWTADADTGELVRATPAP